MHDALSERRPCSEDLVDRLVKRPNDPAHLQPGCAVGWHEHHDVADGTGQDPAFRHRLTHADTGAFFQLKSFPRPPVADQFDSRHQAHLPDVAHLRQHPKALQFIAQVRLQPGARLSRGRRRQQLYAGKSGGGSQLVGRVAVAVEERLELLVIPEECVEEACVVSVAAIGR